MTHKWDDLKRTKLSPEKVAEIEAKAHSALWARNAKGDLRLDCEGYPYPMTGSPRCYKRNWFQKLAAWFGFKLRPECRNTSYHLPRLK
jgi:hypothetical protein